MQGGGDSCSDYHQWMSFGVPLVGRDEDCGAKQYIRNRNLRLRFVHRKENRMTLSIFFERSHHLASNAIQKSSKVKVLALR